MKGAIPNLECKWVLACRFLFRVTHGLCQFPSGPNCHRNGSSTLRSPLRERTTFLSYMILASAHPPSDFGECLRSEGERGLKNPTLQAAQQFHRLLCVKSSVGCLVNCLKKSNKRSVFVEQNKTSESIRQTPRIAPVLGATLPWSIFLRRC